MAELPTTMTTLPLAGHHKIRTEGRRDLEHRTGDKPLPSIYCTDAFRGGNEHWPLARIPLQRP